MVERNRNADPVVRRVPQPLAHVKGVHQQIAMGEHRPLGQPRRAGGELDVRRRRWRPVALCRHPGPASGQRWPRFKIVPGEPARSGSVAQGDQAPETGQPFRRPVTIARRGHLGTDGMNHAHEIRALERTAHDERRHIGHAQGVLELEEPIGRVDVDQHCADARRRELRHDPLRRVHRPDAHVLAPRDSQRDQRPGDSARPAGRARSTTSAGRARGRPGHRGRDGPTTVCSRTLPIVRPDTQGSGPGLAMGIAHLHA